MSESIDWDAWITYALGGDHGDVPAGFTGTIAWQEYEQPLRLRLTGYATTNDQRGMDIVTGFPCHMTCDDAVGMDELEFV
jgi:hypothetical protein